MSIGGALNKLIGKSPLNPLQAHMGKAHAAVNNLPGLVAATQTGDWKEAARIHKDVRSLAAEADKLKQGMRMTLRKSAFMPVSRSDLLELLTSQDLIADEAEAIADLLMSRKIKLPEKVFPPFEIFLASVISVARLAEEAVNELDEVFEVGFAQREIDIVYGKLNELHRQETSAKKLEAKLRGAVFKLERTLEPIDAMFLYQLIDKISAMGRGSERIGNRLLILISV